MLWAFKAFMAFLMNAFAFIGGAAIAGLWAALPTDDMPGGATIEQAANIANAYVALDFGVGLLLAYWTWSATWITYKTLKSWIPTLAGT